MKKTLISRCYLIRNSGTQYQFSGSEIGGYNAYFKGKAEGRSKAKTGWVIADYKTDEVRTDGFRGDLADPVAFYGSQVKLYTQLWSQITGERVLESFIRI